MYKIRFQFLHVLICVLPFLVWTPQTMAAKNKTAARRVKPTSSTVTKVNKPMPTPAVQEVGGFPRLESASVLVVDELGRRIVEKNTQQVRPIASVTKMMTAMVVLDANLPMDEVITITKADQDKLKNSSSRLRLGQAKLNREEMLKIALMSSENRAASALGRTTFPGGTTEFVEAMNNKAQKLGMTNTKFADPTGLFTENVSTAADLVKMLQAARKYPLIHEATTTPEALYRPHPKKPPMRYLNTNRLVRSSDAGFVVQLSKTGFINEAGHCLIMEAKLPSGTYDFVLLNGQGKQSHIADAKRLQVWLEKNSEPKM